MPAFSLIISTKGRATELCSVLQSLEAQTFKDFDVVIVDQNDKLKLGPVLARDWSFPLCHLPRPQDQGLSKGRNVGWRSSAGEYVLFPDDDCWYSPDFLHYAKEQLERSGADILTGRATDEKGRSINGRFERERQRITRKNAWTTQIEWVSIFRRSILEAVDGYDEEIGIGAVTPWQACEGQDIVLRALGAGANCLYDPDLCGHHEEIKVVRPSAAGLRKARAYGRGMGYVLKRHHWSWPTRLYWVLRPLVKVAVFLARADIQTALYYQQFARGRFEGSRGALLTFRR